MPILAERSRTKMSKVQLMAVHNRQYSKILVLRENGRKCQLSPKKAIFDKNVESAIDGCS